MSDHRFRLGQLVRVSRGFSDRTGAGIYEVLRLLPGITDGELRYRVKGPDKIERSVGESQLVLSSQA